MDKTRPGTVTAVVTDGLLPFACGVSKRPNGYRLGVRVRGAEDKTSQDEARQGNARQDKTRQDKTRQG